MRILYGVQATGNGHICRSRELIRELRQLGHDVRVLFSGRAPGLLGEMKEFEPYTVCRGLTFVTSKGKLEYLRTAAQLDFPRFLRDIRSHDASGLDLVITDFEPVSARIAKRGGIPSIAIGHQYAFTHDIPMVKGNPLGLYILRNFAPADHMVGLHWHHFGRPILPPIVPDQFAKETSIFKEKILVYLPFEDLDEIAAAMRDIGTHYFHIYHGSCVRAEDNGNLCFRPFSRDGFLRDLRECGGVICNAGFELPSEALHLGKRILAKPLTGQIEQESNAIALEQLRLATVSRKFSDKVVRDWLVRSHGSTTAPANYPNVARFLAEWIDTGRWDDVNGLANKAWISGSEKELGLKENTADRQ